MMSLNPLFNRPQTHAYSSQTTQPFMHIGLNVFDQPNRQFFRATNSTTDQAQLLANRIRSHIRSFYQHKLHLEDYEPIDISCVANLPQYSVQAIQMIDSMLRSIQKDTQDKITKYYTLIENVAVLLQEKILPLVYALIPEAISSVLQKVFNLIFHFVKKIVTDRIGGSISAITKQCIRHMAKDRLVFMMHDPIGHMTVTWNDENDIFGEETSFLSIFNEMLSDIPSVFSFFASLMSEGTSAKPVTVKKATAEPKKESPVVEEEKITITF